MEFEFLNKNNIKYLFVLNRENINFHRMFNNNAYRLDENEFKVLEHEFKSFLKPNSKIKCLLAKEDSVFIGFISFSFSEIFELFVTENHRNKGVGKQLILQVIKILNENSVEKIKVVVDVSNTGALKFYEHLNFKKCSFNLFLDLKGEKN